jgi:hypothetical protein
MISWVPTPLAVNSTMAARQVCFKIRRRDSAR